MELYFYHPVTYLGLPCWFSSKESACDAEDAGLVPGSGRSPGEGKGNPLLYSCLGNPMDRGAWWATVHGVTKELDMTEQLNNSNTITHSKQWDDLHLWWFIFIFISFLRSVESFAISSQILKAYMQRLQFIFHWWEEERYREREGSDQGCWMMTNLGLHSWT